MILKDGKSPISRFLGSRLFLIVGILAVVLVSLGVGRSYYSGYKINKEIETLQSEIQSLENKKLESMEILEYVMSSGFVEEKARTELNMKKEGEKLIVFKNDNVYGGDGQIEPEDGSGQKMSNALKWWYYFTSHSVGQNNLITE